MRNGKAQLHVRLTLFPSLFFSLDLIECYLLLHSLFAIISFILLSILPHFLSLSLSLSSNIIVLHVLAFVHHGLKFSSAMYFF